MKATQMLHDLGQSIWLDNITRASFSIAARSNATSTISRSRV